LKIKIGIVNSNNSFNRIRMKMVMKTLLNRIKLKNQLTKKERMRRHLLKSKGLLVEAERTHRGERRMERRVTRQTRRKRIRETRRKKIKRRRTKKKKNIRGEGVKTVVL